MNCDHHSIYKSENIYQICCNAYIIYSFCYSLPKFKKKIRSLALKAFCNIEGDLVVVDNWPSSEGTSNQSMSSLYRKPAVRARSGARRSEYSSSSQASNASQASISSMRSAGRTGLVVKNKKGTGTTHKTHKHAKKGDIKMMQIKSPKRTHESIPENVNVCQVDLSKAIGADLQVLQSLLKQKHLKLSLDDSAKLVIAQCESKDSSSV